MEETPSHERLVPLTGIAQREIAKSKVARASQGDKCHLVIRRRQLLLAHDAQVKLPVCAERLSCGNPIAV